MKFLTSIALLFLISNVFSQNIEDKKIQAGIVVGGGANLLNIQTNQIAKNGAGSIFTVGMGLNWNFSKNVGFSTGLQFDLENFKYQNRSNPDSTQLLHYQYNDKNVLRKKDTDTPQGTYLMQSRTQQPIYLTIPTMLLFRTNMIGYFRYFGKFGLRNSFLLTQRSTDQGINTDVNGTSQQQEMKHMKTKNDMVFFRSSVGISIGAEWNFSGTSSLSLEAGYYYGFTPLYYNGDDNRSIYSVTPGGNRNYRSFKMNESQLIFKASILF